MVLSKLKRPPSSKRATLAQSLSRAVTDVLESASRSVAADNAAGALARGKAFQVAGYLSEAAESYGEALQAKPDLDEAAARLALVQMYSGQAESALQTASTLASRNPSFEVRELTSKQKTSALTILGDALALNGRTDEAIDSYKRARKASANDAFAAGRLAQAYLSKGDARRAAEFADAASRNPRFAGLGAELSGGVSSAVPLDRRILVTVHGRPLLVDEAPRLAPIMYGNDDWCGTSDEP